MNVVISKVSLVTQTVMGIQADVKEKNDEVDDGA